MSNLSPGSLSLYYDQKISDCFSNIFLTLNSLLYFLNVCFCLQHCAGINCLALLKSPVPDGHDSLFTGSRDGTLKRWTLADNNATFSTTFESHIDWVLQF